MNRRELLTGLMSLPTAMVFRNKSGEKCGVSVGIPDRGKFICFVDPSLINLDDFCEHANGLPAGTPVIPVMDGDFDHAVRIYKVSDD